MAALALTQLNLEFVKQSLRQRCEGVRSSHLSEALAAGCGYHTHMALVAAIRECDPRWPEVARVDDSRFLARLAGLGYMVDGGVLPAIVRSPKLPKGLWRIFRDGDIPAMDLWFRECQRRDIPYVYVTPRRKYARIDWDCISTDTRHDDVVATEASNALLDGMYKTFQRLAAPNKAMFEGSAFVGQIDHLTIDAALSLADEMFIALKGAMRFSPAKRSWG